VNAYFVYVTGISPDTGETFPFQQMVWADSMQGALNELATLFFKTYKKSHLLLLSGKGCTTSTGSGGAHKGWVSGKSDDEDKLDLSSDGCSISIHKLKALSGDSPKELPGEPGEMEGDRSSRPMFKCRCNRTDGCSSTKP
jgi:hypothetical protein